MSAEVLREAARLMRERADVWEYHAGRWVIVPGPAGHSEIRAMDMDDPDLDPHDVDNSTFVVDCDTTVTSEHIASWHPAVALAVARLLENDADFDDVLKKHGARGLAHDSDSVLIARAYLGDQP